MIRSFKHAGLKRFFLSGSKAGIQPKHANRVSLQLGALNRAKMANDMAQPGWGFHPLTGPLSGHYAVWVNGNWRITFRFENGDAEVVDYQDYH